MMQLNPSAEYAPVRSLISALGVEIGFSHMHFFLHMQIVFESAITCHKGNSHYSLLLFFKTDPICRSTASPPRLQSNLFFCPCRPIKVHWYFLQHVPFRLSAEQELLGQAARETGGLEKKRNNEPWNEWTVKGTHNKPVVTQQRLCSQFYVGRNLRGATTTFESVVVNYPCIQHILDIFHNTYTFILFHRKASCKKR